MRALISVSDKTGVVDFAKGLRALGWEVIATGGTMKLLSDSGVEVINISDVTGFPEICDGRVKTLHPNVHGGLLARRDDPEHLKALKDNNIEFIDMVCVNLYPFRQTIAKPDVKMEDAIENIDIGGPSMLRSAAKNWADVTVVCDPADYEQVLGEIRAGGCRWQTFPRPARRRRGLRRRICSFRTWRRRTRSWAAAFCPAAPSRRHASAVRCP